MTPNENTSLLSSNSAGENSRGRSISWKAFAKIVFLGLMAMGAGVFFFQGNRKDNERTATTTAIDNVLLRKKKANRECNNPSQTLTLVYENKMKKLYSRDQEKKYETSSVIVVDNLGYAICDSSWSIYQFGLDLKKKDPSNVRLDDPTREDTAEEDSGYEAMSFHEGIFYVVRESIELEDEHGKDYHAMIEEIEIDDDDEYRIQRQCPTEFVFEGDSKGFEGVWAAADLAGDVILLGLCEGNHCSEENKNDRGNGRIVVMKQSIMDDGSCLWETVRTVNIPPSANFLDYSAMAVSKDNTVAITSQEDSQVWIGRLLGQQADSGLWNVEELAFDDSSKILDFPKDDKCKTVYCNIEGIQWLDDGTLLAASDKMKGGGKQDSRCKTKDQSLHVFNVPE